MLVRSKDADWVLVPHVERTYETEAEKKFFTAVENPKSTTETMKEMVRQYGRFINKGR
jgi:hypothetical protein